VVSGGHVMESSSQIHLDQSSVEVLLSSVQFSTVGDISISISGVSSVVGEDLSVWKAIWLI